MTRRRTPKRVSAERVRPLLIRVGEDKLIEDVELAGFFELTLKDLYGLIGRKWMHTSAGTRLRSRPSLAFTQADVVLIASIVSTLLRNETLREIGMDIADAMNIKRRSSKNRKPPPRRADDPAKSRLYSDALETMERVVEVRLRAEAKKIFGS